MEESKKSPIPPQDTDIMMTEAHSTADDKISLRRGNAEEQKKPPKMITCLIFDEQKPKSDTNPFKKCFLVRNTGTNWKTTKLGHRVDGYYATEDKPVFDIETQVKDPRKEDPNYIPGHHSKCSVMDFKLPNFTQDSHSITSDQPSRVLYICNISKKITEENLRNMFSEFGEIQCLSTHPTLYEHLNCIIQYRYEDAVNNDSVNRAISKYHKTYQYGNQVLLHGDVSAHILAQTELVDKKNHPELENTITPQRPKRELKPGTTAAQILALTKPNLGGTSDVSPKSRFEPHKKRVSLLPPYTREFVLAHDVYGDTIDSWDHWEPILDNGKTLTDINQIKLGGTPLIHAVYRKLCKEIFDVILEQTEKNVVLPFIESLMKNLEVTLSQPEPSANIRIPTTSLSGLTPLPDLDDDLHFESIRSKRRSNTTRKISRVRRKEDRELSHFNKSPSPTITNGSSSYSKGFFDKDSDESSEEEDFGASPIQNPHRHYYQSSSEEEEEIEIEEKHEKIHQRHQHFFDFDSEEDHEDQYSSIKHSRHFEDDNQRKTEEEDGEEEDISKGHFESSDSEDFALIEEEDFAVQQQPLVQLPKKRGRKQKQKRSKKQKTVHYDIPYSTPSDFTIFSPEPAQNEPTEEEIFASVSPEERKELNNILSAVNFQSSILYGFDLDEETTQYAAQIIAQNCKWIFFSFLHFKDRLQIFLTYYNVTF